MADKADTGRRGRQVVPSQQNIKRAAMLGALKQGHTRRAACQVAGIHPSTFYLWLRKEPDFVLDVAQAEAQAEAFYLDCVIEGAKVDWRAAAWWLERRRPETYGRKPHLLILREIAQKIEGLSDKELMRMVYPEGDEYELNGRAFTAA